MADAIATDSQTDIANGRHRHRQRHSNYYYSPNTASSSYVPSWNGQRGMKDIEETRSILDQTRYYDDRTITPDMVDQWHHALLRLTIEASFDAVHAHFESCGPRTPLTAGHVLEHANRTRLEHEETERRQRARDRNETVFDNLTDHRDNWERQAALNAMRAGRAHLNQILANRTPGDNRTKGVGAGAH